MLRFIEDLGIELLALHAPPLPAFAVPIMSPSPPVVITGEPPTFPCVELVGIPTNDFLGAGP